MHDESKAPALPERLRPLLNRLRWQWFRHWGWPGGLGLVLLAAALILPWHRQTVLDAEEAALQQRLHLRQTEQARQVRAAAAAGPTAASAVEAARTALPGMDQRGALVRQLLQLAEGGGLAIGAADYTLQPEEPGLQRLRVTLPLGGSYAQLRRFIARVLNQMPATALDSLQLDRPADQPEMLLATLRLSIWFRSEAP